MINEYKEVHYWDYCPTCKYKKKKAVDEPCDECLNNPTNLYSHKPVKYEEKESKWWIKY